MRKGITKHERLSKKSRISKRRIGTPDDPYWDDEMERWKLGGDTHVKIWQIKYCKEWADDSFEMQYYMDSRMGWDWFSSRFSGIDLNMYNRTWSGELNVHGDLEELFSMLQDTRPMELSRALYSLSVGNLVTMNGATYFVDEWGFKDVTSYISNEVRVLKKTRVAKREWEGNDYSPISTEQDIERALAKEYSNFDGLVKIQYVGTDWAMGSQYWVALFKCKDSMESHACVTVLDWNKYEPQLGLFNGIATMGYNYGTLEEMEQVFEEKVARESRGTRKSRSKTMRKNADDYSELKKTRVAKREWWGDDYSPISTEQDIERALAEEYSGFDGLVKIQYIGTDWVMGSQYWVALFKKRSEYFPYACVTVIDWTYDNPQRGIITGDYVDGELDDMKSVYHHKVNRLKISTRKSIGKTMRKNADDREAYLEFAKYLDKTWDFVNEARLVLDELFKSGRCPQSVFPQVDSLYEKLGDVLMSIGDISVSEIVPSDWYPKSAKKSKSVYKASPYTLDWCGDKLSDALEDLNDCFMSNNTSSHHSFFNSLLQEYGIDMHTLIQAVRSLCKEIRARSDAEYSASAKKSKRDMLKSKLDELMDEEEEEDEEEDEDIKKPMNDMFLDARRKRRSKTRKSNDEKGEDADDYREESDGDDVSDSETDKPEDADDNENDTDSPNSGDTLPEDADGQENQSNKRRKRMSKLSVTNGGGARYNGRENYNQSPMMREAIDRYRTEKDLAKTLQARVDEIHESRKNKDVNNSSPIRIKGRR